jgi:hypothetical protein
MELNALHSSIDGVVSNNILPSSENLASDLKDTGFQIAKCEEKPGLYLIMAKKK